MVLGTLLVLGGAALVASASGSKDRDDDSKKRLERQATKKQLEAIERRVVLDRKFWEKWERENPRASKHLPRMRRPLRLLSIDGGGVRGIISLLVLQSIMERVAPGANARPCDYFDLIAGTSTGGLIAIMLGRLRMTIPDRVR